MQKNSEADSKSQLARGTLLATVFSSYGCTKYAEFETA